MGKQQAHDRIPRGENYERLRRLGPSPFSCYFKDRPSTTRGPILLYMDVNTGHGRTGRIGVHEGDDLHTLAKNFAIAFQLDAQMECRLEEMLHQACELKRRGALVATPPNAA